MSGWAGTWKTRGISSAKRGPMSPGSNKHARFHTGTPRACQLAKHLCRDSIDNLQRLKLGISIPGLLENGEHLRRQIAASQCGSMADMFRYAGLLPSPDRAVASGSNGQRRACELKRETSEGV
jgi:hypothetical protein